MLWRLALAGFAIYFPLAIWAKVSYVDPTPKGALVFQLYKPFVSETGFSWRVTSPLPAEWVKLHGAKPTSIYENDRPLVERGSSWRAISALGHGRYLIQGEVIMFSTSDGSDPNHNGRRYWMVVP